MTEESLAIGRGGWTQFRSPDLPEAVFLRFAENESGRLVPVDLFLAHDRGIEVTLVRQVPFARVESWANEADMAARIRSRMLLPGADLRTAASHFATTFGKGDQDNWVARMMAAQVPGSGEPEAPRPPDRKDEAVVPDARVRVRLTIPKHGGDYGDEFYRRVAAAYMWLARTGGKGPAERLAESNHVPVSTVHRWVKEARRRGLLAAGRPGKAG